MMHRRLYTRQLPHKPMWGGVMVIATLVVVGIVTALVPPGKWWIEGTVVGVFWTGLFVGGAWLSGRRKWSLVASTGIVGLLLMNRWGILDLPMLGLWILVLGLVGLVN